MSAYLNRYAVREGGGGHAHLLRPDARTTLCGLDAAHLQARRHDEPVCSRCTSIADRLDQEASDG